MVYISKRQKVLRQKAAGLAPQEPRQAVAALKGLDTGLPKGVKPCKFDQTVEVALRLGIDPKQADQIVRGSIVLPHGIGKTQRVLVFCQGPNVAVAEQAGADYAGGKELAEKIKEGWHPSLLEGLRVAERDRTPVLIDLWATWCKNCLVMDRTTLADPEVVKALSGYTLIKLQAEDPEQSPAREVMERARGIGLPTYVVLYPR